MAFLRRSFSFERIERGRAWNLLGSLTLSDGDLPTAPLPTLLQASVLAGFDARVVPCLDRDPVHCLKEIFHNPVRGTAPSAIQVAMAPFDSPTYRPADGERTRFWFGDAGPFILDSSGEIRVRMEIHPGSRDVIITREDPTGRSRGLLLESVQVEPPGLETPVPRNGWLPWPDGQSLMTNRSSLTVTSSLSRSTMATLLVSGRELLHPNTVESVRENRLLRLDRWLVGRVEELDGSSVPSAFLIIIDTGDCETLLLATRGVDLHPSPDETVQHLLSSWEHLADSK